MDTTQTSLFLPIALSLVATLFGLLTVLMGWLGAKVIARLDAVVEKLNQVAGELHSRINGIDTRLTVVETKIVEKRMNQ